MSDHAKRSSEVLEYKRDIYGNSIHTQVSWSTEVTTPTRPIALLYHGGGILVGSYKILPQAEIEYLENQGFIVIAPNYRLCPQVTAAEAVSDCEEVYDWVVSTFRPAFESRTGIRIDTDRVVAAGHSTGGTLALHIGANKPNVKAVTAFYPTLYASDMETSGHKPYTLPPFGSMPDFAPTEADWESITPPRVQLSEAPLAMPGTIPQPRNKWQASLLKSGKWLETICPDGEYARIDPLTKVNEDWPAVMIVQGDHDKIPASGLDLAERAVKEMRGVGVKAVQLEVVNGADHMFDLAVHGAVDGGEKWAAIKNGLDWLSRHV